METRLSFSLFFLFAFYLLSAQTIEKPIILELIEDDHVATIYWNSKTNIYDTEYDPEKIAGVFSYKIEWGKVNDTNVGLDPHIKATREGFFCQQTWHDCSPCNGLLTLLQP